MQSDSMKLSRGDALLASLGMLGIPQDEIALKGRFRAWLRDEYGRLRDYRDTENIVTNAGLAEILVNGLTSASYVGLVANTPTFAAGTALTGLTFTDVPFSESVRPTWTKTLSGQTYSNSASKARFSFTGAGTNGLGGAFLAKASSKTETASILVAGKAFTGGNLGAVANGYTLDIQYDITAA